MQFLGFWQRIFEIIYLHPDSNLAMLTFVSMLLHSLSVFTMQVLFPSWLVQLLPPLQPTKQAFFHSQSISSYPFAPYSSSSLL